jgi:predicted lipase
MQNTLYIVFRGSTSIPDWIGNIDTLLNPYPNCPTSNSSSTLSSHNNLNPNREVAYDVTKDKTDCYVHKGFYHDEQAIYNSTIASILALQALHPTASLVVTGHSLGAAMATLLALDLLPHWTCIGSAGCVPSSVKLINFGSPRVGNEAFAAYASQVLGESDAEAQGGGKYRLTHYRDVVPHLPWSRRFEHIDGK